MRGAQTDSRKWWIATAMGIILGVILLDETVVGVALPTIQKDLSMSEGASHWVVNIYMLVLAGFAAASGKIGDMFGHRLVMNTGLAIFGVASIACGFAESGAWLIVARGVQGLGAAIIFPLSLAMLTMAFPAKQRGLAMGIAGAVGTVFLALGPLVGGALTDFASWRWIFWVNPPVVLAVAVFIAKAWIEPKNSDQRERLDKTGLLLLVGGLSMVVFAIMEGPELGWTTPLIPILFCSGIALLIAFALVELRVSAPLMEVELFSNSSFTACNLVIFSAQYTKMAMFVFGAFYLQSALNMSPLMAGLALLPTVAPQIVTAPIAGRVADRFGARWPSILALLAMGVGLFIVGWVVPFRSYTLMFPGLLIWGLSQAFVFIAPQRAVMSAVPPAREGQAGGIAMSAQLLGGTVGMAVSSTVYTMTADFQAVFISNALFTALVLAIAWMSIDRDA